MSIKIPFRTVLKQIGILLVVSYLVFRGTFVDDVSLGLNLMTGVNLLLSFIFWGTICLHTYCLIPGYLFQGRYKMYIVYTGCLVIFMLFAMVISAYIMGQHYIMPDSMRILGPDFFFYLFLNALALVLYFFAFSFTIFLRQWVSYHQRLNELENNNLQTELNHLKEQLQPDFLSKMLNKARILSKEAPDRASTLIFKLSRLLRYQLYESAHEKVLLGDDVRFMTDYLELEKVCHPAFTYELRMENRAVYQQVPPLLFMPVIEFAIRENVDREKEMERNVTVDFQIEENMLLFTCTRHLAENTCHLTESISRRALPTFEKLRQRLDLLYPKGSYLLTNRCDNHLFCITISLEIQ